MKLALFGYGGHAREVAGQINEEVEFFVDDIYANDIAQPISKFDPKEYTMMVAVAESQDRKNIVNKLPKETKYFSFLHPSVQILADDIEVGEGSFIGANSILTTNIKIGKHALLNRGNQIGHDSVIGDYFSMMPGAIVGGNVNIGNNVYLGSLSNIREKINIKHDVIIGMNGAVVKDISNPGVYVGVPVKIIK